MSVTSESLIGTARNFLHVRSLDVDTQPGTRCGCPPAPLAPGPGCRKIRRSISGPTVEDLGTAAASLSLCVQGTSAYGPLIDTPLEEQPAFSRRGRKKPSPGSVCAFDLPPEHGGWVPGLIRVRTTPRRSRAATGARLSVSPTFGLTYKVGGKGLLLVGEPRSRQAPAAVPGPGLYPPDRGFSFRPDEQDGILTPLPRELEGMPLRLEALPRSNAWWTRATSPSCSTDKAGTCPTSK